MGNFPKQFDQHGKPIVLTQTINTTSTCQNRKKTHWKKTRSLALSSIGYFSFPSYAQIVKVSNSIIHWVYHCQNLSIVPQQKPTHPPFWHNSHLWSTTHSPWPITCTTQLIPYPYTKSKKNSKRDEWNKRTWNVKQSSPRCVVID